MESKEEILEKLLAEEKPKCPHCNKTMTLWEIPPVTVGDGLGWGVPFLYVCFNDDCPLFRKGWDDIMEQVGQSSSYRCMNYPGTDQYELLPVFSSFGGSGQVVTDETMARQKAHDESIKSGFSILADCYVEKDLVQIVKMALDGEEPTRVRIKAVEMLGDIGNIEAVDPLRNTKFGNPKLKEMAETSISKIHQANFTRECPHCAEIIKKKANICKHCKMEVAGQ